MEKAHSKFSECLNPPKVKETHISRVTPYPVVGSTHKCKLAFSSCLITTIRSDRQGEDYKL